MKITKNLPLHRLAALVCTSCLENGIDAVLSGGACVSIYTENRYLSYDLDFVPRTPVPRKKIRSVMEALGYEEEGRFYRHPDNPFIVDFLIPPLSVGEEPVKEIREIRSGTLVLRLLSPTDCVKDRLAAYYHWNDRPSLDQAILVCLGNDVDLREVRRWSLEEGKKDHFSRFRRRLTQAARNE